MGLTMAICAEQDTFRDLRLDTDPASRNTVHRDAELLGSWIEMVELECVGGCKETAAAARAACSGNRSELRVLP